MKTKKAPIDWHIFNPAKAASLFSMKSTARRPVNREKIEASAQMQVISIGMFQLKEGSPTLLFEKYYAYFIYYNDMYNSKHY